MCCGIGASNSSEHFMAMTRLQMSSAAAAARAGSPVFELLPETAAQPQVAPAQATSFGGGGNRDGGSDTSDALLAALRANAAA